jgi:hypothetical protein
MSSNAAPVTSPRSPRTSPRTPLRQDPVTRSPSNSPSYHVRTPTPTPEPRLSRTPPRSRPAMMNPEPLSHRRQFLARSTDVGGPRPANDTPMEGSRRSAANHLGQRSQIQPQNLPNPHNQPGTSATVPLLQIVTLVDHAGFVQSLGTAYVPAQSVLRLVDGALRVVLGPAR